jgi:hypothetical protein
MKYYTFLFNLLLASLVEGTVALRIRQLVSSSQPLLSIALQPQTMFGNPDDLLLHRHGRDLVPFEPITVPF